MIRSTAELARHIGLARTTVSRVLNGQPGLKPKTIARVQQALAETGFTPNAHAAQLRGKRAALVGVWMEDLATPPMVRKLATLQRVLRARGFASLIEVVAPGGGRDVVRHFQSLRVEAVVFIGHFVREEIEACIADLTRQGTPHVVMDHYGLAGASTVALDRAAGMELVMNHLLDLGHRTFGGLGMTKGPTGSNSRQAGIQAALRARGLDPEACIVSLDHLHERQGDFQYGRRLAASFAALRGRPTAYLGYNDEIALGALRGFQEAGFKVPRDLSITGFNNQEICLLTSPELTTVDQSIEATVAAVADFVVGRIGAGPPVRPVVRRIPPTLVVRESTGPARS